jgi:hypothetical protein
VAKARSQTPHYRLAGLEPLGGRSRRWRDVRTGETLSYNAGRRRLEALSASHRGSVAQFERALARTKDVEHARREAGLSKRGLDAYRKSFIASGRESASPWIKEKGRWRFEQARFSRVHTFIDIRGQVRHVAFGGRNLIAMQDYREVWSPSGGSGNQAELDAWFKTHPGGVTGDDGETYFPETELNAIRARINRMPPRERKNFAADVRYVMEVA